MVTWIWSLEIAVTWGQGFAYGQLILPMQSMAPLQGGTLNPSQGSNLWTLENDSALILCEKALWFLWSCVIKSHLFLRFECHHVNKTWILFVTWHFPRLRTQGLRIFGDQSAFDSLLHEHFSHHSTHILPAGVTSGSMLLLLWPILRPHLPPPCWNISL